MTGIYWGVILGQTVGVLLFVLISFYPFYLRRYKPGHYTGFWMTVGEGYRTPGRAALTSIALILGTALVIFIMTGKPRVSKALLDLAFPLLLLFVGIVFGARLLQLEKRIEEVEERLREVEKESRSH